MIPPNQIRYHDSDLVNKQNYWAMVMPLGVMDLSKRIHGTMEIAEKILFAENVINVVSVLHENNYAYSTVQISST